MRDLLKAVRELLEATPESKDFQNKLEALSNAYDEAMAPMWTNEPTDVKPGLSGEVIPMKEEEE